MSSDDEYTYNELSNEDKELLMANGYIPGELSPDEEQEILRDLRDQVADEDGLEPLGNVVSPDEQDGND